MCNDNSQYAVFVERVGHKIMKRGTWYVIVHFSFSLVSAYRNILIMENVPVVSLYSIF